MFPEQPLDTPAGPLNYARGPASGPPLILLHGVTRRWQDWTALLPPLAARWQVFAPDFRGHGGSARTPGRYLVADYVADAAALVRACPEPPVLFGHSLGAMVALAAAAQPSRVRAVVLEDPPFETMGGGMRDTVFQSLFVGIQQVLAGGAAVADLARRLADVRLTTPGSPLGQRLGEVRDPTSLRFSASCLAKLDPGVLTPVVAGQWLDGYDLPATLARVSCPVLLLQADIKSGGMLTDPTADRIEHGVPECLRVYFPGVGHLIHGTQTETTLRLVTGFLESLR